MADTVTLLVVLAALAALVLTSLRLNRPEALAADRAREIVRAAGGGGIAREAGTDADWRRTVHDLVETLGNRLPLFTASQRRQIRKLLQQAGLRHAHALSAFFTIKVTLGIAGALAGLGCLRLLPGDGSQAVSAIVILAGLQIGLVAPELVLHHMIRKRRQAIHRALPDALDLMVICTNAGYGLGATITYIATRLKPVCPALADELEATAHEIQVNADLMASLRGLADRSGVESLRALVSTLIQSHQYGTPITQSLKTLAQAERTARLLRLEEKGAKLATKLTLPMMLLILPAVIVLTAAPAVMRLSGLLEVLGK